MYREVFLCGWVDGFIFLGYSSSVLCSLGPLYCSNKATSHVCCVDAKSAIGLSRGVLLVLSLLGPRYDRWFGWGSLLGVMLLLLLSGRHLWLIFAAKPGTGCLVNLGPPPAWWVHLVMHILVVKIQQQC